VVGRRPIEVRWVYYQTEGAHISVSVSQILEPSSVDAVMDKKVDVIAKEIVRAKRDVKDPLKLPPNVNACSAYGGCFYREHCNISPREYLHAMSTQHQTMLDRLKAVVPGTPINPPSHAYSDSPRNELPLEPSANALPAQSLAARLAAMAPAASAAASVATAAPAATVAQAAPAAPAAPAGGLAARLAAVAAAAAPAVAPVAAQAAASAPAPAPAPAAPAVAPAAPSVAPAVVSGVAPASAVVSPGFLSLAERISALEHAPSFVEAAGRNAELFAKSRIAAALIEKGYEPSQVGELAVRIYKALV
jgi:hypothetical protein